MYSARVYGWLRIFWPLVIVWRHIQRRRSRAQLVRDVAEALYRNVPTGTARELVTLYELYAYPLTPVVSAAYLKVEEVYMLAVLLSAHVIQADYGDEYPISTNDALQLVLREYDRFSMRAWPPRPF